MIVSLVKGMDQAEHALLMDAMFQARKRLFADRLGWHVDCDEEGREIDDRDGPDALYVILHDSAGMHLGSLRLLPTTKKTLMNNAFAAVLEVEAVQVPAMWECSRLCIEGRIENGRDEVTARLLLGLCETALGAGIDHILCTFHSRMIPAFASAGWVPDLVGQSGEGEQAIYLGCWAASEGTAAALRKAAGVHGSILGRAARQQAAQLLREL